MADEFKNKIEDLSWEHEQHHEYLKNCSECYKEQVTCLCGQPKNKKYTYCEDCQKKAEDYENYLESQDGLIKSISDDRELW